MQKLTTCFSHLLRGGYWFTIVLFEMQIVYSFVMYVVNRIHNTRHKSIAVLSIALLSYMMTKIVNMNSIVMDIFCLKGLFTYFPFFLLGVLCKMNNNMYVMCLSNKRVQFALLAILVIGFKTNYIPSVVLSSVSCFVVIFSIRKMEENMTYETCLAIVKKMTKSFFSLFSCIGQYSIEIYFLHFLLLFKLPQSVSDYLYSGYIANSYGHTYSSIIELIVVGSVSLFLALLCIMISLFLKQLPFMDRLLFGKIKTNK